MLKYKFVSFNVVIWLIVMKSENDNGKLDHINKTNRPRRRYSDEGAKCSVFR